MRQEQRPVLQLENCGQPFRRGRETAERVRHSLTYGPLPANAAELIRVSRAVMRSLRSPVARRAAIW